MRGVEGLMLSPFKEEVTTDSAAFDLYEHLLKVENFKGSQFSRSKSKSLVNKRAPAEDILASIVT